MIKIRNLKKVIDGKSIINGIDLGVNNGDFFIILGPNGAGKTTTIRMLVGAIPPTEGFIEINGYKLDQNEMEYKRQIGYVPDVPYLYDKLTGLEYLKLLASLWRIDEKQAIKNMEQYLILFDISDRKNDYICTYSHGMKQKIALCGALINKPNILVLDEPLINLDPLIAKKIKDFLIDYCKAGNTVFLSTHILEVAERLYTSLAIFKDGKITARMNKETVRNKYQGNNNLEDIYIKNVSS